MLKNVNMSDNKIINNIPCNSFTGRPSELISFYDPNSYTSSLQSYINDADVDSDSGSISSIKFEDDIVSSTYYPRLSEISNNTIKLNDLYEREKYISFIVKQNTYLNNTQYQKIFNQIIFNFKI